MPSCDNDETLKPDLTMQLEKGNRPQRPDEIAEIAIKNLEEGQHIITTMLVGYLIKGVAYEASIKNSFVADAFWSFLGWVALNLSFAMGDLLKQCRKLGKEKGLKKVRKVKKASA